MSWVFPQRLLLPVSKAGFSVGAGLPAKQNTRWVAPASPVFAGKPAPTGVCVELQASGKGR
ncbi:hypothetical protein EGN69_17415 [Pseudomonas monteilii]|nr:hypothetical protein B7H19_14525 [Pseudomonas putida]RPD92105.1 hypothetical protein EGN69_17415 [Pseudomonas monteilii]